MTSPADASATCSPGCGVTPMSDAPDEETCGWSYDHVTEITYEGPDGIQWVCRRCGAEGWEEQTDG